MRKISLAAICLATLAACSENPEPKPHNLPQPESKGARLLVSRCGSCHVAPLPSVHAAKVWPGVVNRMQMRMRSRGYPPLAQEEIVTLLDYLQLHAARVEP